jgi:hypothetical protein
VTERELNHILVQARTPARHSAYWNEFPEIIIRRLRAGRSGQSQPAVKRGKRFAWSMAFAAACSIVVILAAHRIGQSRRTSRELREARNVFREVAALFPNQLQAIVFENGQSRLVLAESPTVAASIPVMLRICVKEGCQRVITFSGQQVRVNGEACDVLVDARGNIIVAGQSFVWSNTIASRGKGNMSITAQTLGTML